MLIQRHPLPRRQGSDRGALAAAARPPIALQSCAAAGQDRSPLAFALRERVIAEVSMECSTPFTLIEFNLICTTAPPLNCLGLGVSNRSARLGAGWNHSVATLQPVSQGGGK